MRVLHVIPSVAAADGGPSRAMAEIERALAGRGIACTTATTDAGLSGQGLPYGEPVTGAAATRYYFPATTGFYKVSLGLARWLAANIRRFDVVHVHALFSFAPVVAGLLARRARLPYVVRPLGVLTAYGMAERRPLLKKLSFALMERHLLEQASAVHFTSGAEQAEAEALGIRCKGVVIPLGIDLGGVAQAAERPGWCFNLLLLSRLDPVKNIEQLLRAVAITRARFPRLTLQVAGTGAADYVRALQSLTRELGIADRVEWHGYVEGARKAQLFAQADAFVLPSHSESFGISVLEALATGLPCIVSNKVALSAEIAAAGAGAVVSTDAAGIAAGIGAVFGDDAAHADKRRAARALAVGSFSNEAMGERLESLYRTIARTA